MMSLALPMLLTIAIVNQEYPARPSLWTGHQLMGYMHSGHELSHELAASSCIAAECP